MRRLNAIAGPLVYAACCLLPACSGCIHAAPRPRHMLEGVGVAKLEDGFGAEGPALDADDVASPGEDSAAKPRPEPERKAAHPDPAAPAGPCAEEEGCEGEGTSAECAPLGIPIPSFGSRILGVWGGLGDRLRARVAARRYHLPRFHPVPLQPAFLPGAGGTPGEDRGDAPRGGHVPAILPMPRPPQTEPPLPALDPDKIPQPQPESTEREQIPLPLGPLDASPHPVGTASRPESWLFNPPPLRKPARSW